MANAKEGGSAYIDLRCTVRNDSEEVAAVTFAAADALGKRNMKRLTYSIMAVIADVR